MNMPRPALPEGFLPAIAHLLGGQLGAFLASYEQPAIRGIRYSARRSQEPHPWCAAPVPWARGAYVLRDGAQPGAHPLHWAGAYYIQEPSAMAAAAAMAPQPGERVLDLCAAPGGKATQMADFMDRQGLLIANDPVYSRALELSRNMERLGIGHAVVLSASPEQLADALPGFFDRVLVDAPCSGEGMFRKNPDSRAHWHPGLPAQNAKRQLAILTEAARMLKPGGRMVYSTCTFNSQENEGVIAAFQKSHPAFALVPFALPGLPAAPEGLLRLWPHQVQGEGHFVALLMNQGAAGEEKPPKKETPPVSLPAVLRREAEAVLRDWVRDRLVFNHLLGQTLVQLPAGCPDLQGLRVLRGGLHLAQQLGKTLRPDHALALGAEPLKVHALSLQEAEAYRRGAVLAEPTGGLSGYVAPALTGWPLGWGKATNGQIKNHYPKGLRNTSVSED